MQETLDFGSLFNMFLIGYTIDFCTWLWNQILPMEIFQLWSVRIGILIPSIILFVLSAALYMDVDMGTAPYDAIPYLISVRLPNVSFQTIRIAFDLIVTLIGWVLGETPGAVTVLTVLMWTGHQHDGRMADKIILNCLGSINAWGTEFSGLVSEMLEEERCRKLTEEIC